MSNPKAKFFRCPHCGNLMFVVNGSGVVPGCCGEPMLELKPNTNGAGEKHTPVVDQDGQKVTVTVSEVLHPMQEDHWIEWVYLETDKGGYYRTFKAGEKPEAVFEIQPDEQPMDAYAYCNLHGLWKNEIEIN